MLAKRTVGVQAGGDSLANRRIGKRTPGILFDFSPAMVQVLKTVGIVVALLVLLAIMHGLATKMGYEVVNAQHQVVQLKKDNDTLQVEVAALKSPTRIQKIAAEELGLVLPDAFVYSTKATQGDRGSR